MTCQPSNIKAPISNNRSKESREQAVAAETELSSAALRHGVTPWLLINVSASYFATTHFAREKVEREREREREISNFVTMLRDELREEKRGGERKEKKRDRAPFKGRYSTTVAFIVRISTMKKQVRLESVTSVPREQRADDQCDVRWWASRSDGSPLIID